MQPASTLQTYLNSLLSPVVVTVAVSLRALRAHVDSALGGVRDRLDAHDSAIAVLAGGTATSSAVDNNVTQWSPNFTTSHMMSATIDATELTLMRPTRNGHVVEAANFTLEVTFLQDCVMTFSADMHQVITGQPPQLVAGRYLMLIDAFPDRAYIRIQQLY